MTKTEYFMLTAEKQFDTLPVPTIVYGIRAQKDGKLICEIEDFSLNENYTETVIDLLKSEDPEDVHISEILEDFVI